MEADRIEREERERARARKEKRESAARQDSIGLDRWRGNGADNGKSDSRKDRGRDDDRHKDRDRDRDRDRDDRSRDRRDRDRDSSSRRKDDRGRSGSREGERRRKRRSGWDAAPPGVDPHAPALIYPIPASRAIAPGAPGGQGGVPAAQTRQARRLFVGNIPHETKEDDLKYFFERVMAGAEISTVPGEIVLSVYLNVEKKFGFLEFRSIPETNAALALDGIEYRGSKLKLKRPSEYASPAGGGSSGAAPATVPNKPFEIFCGNLHTSLAEVDIRELLDVYGLLRSFQMAKDPMTGAARGFCFFEYVDATVTDEVIEGLNGLVIANKALVCRRAHPATNPQGLPAVSDVLALPFYNAAAPPTANPAGLPQQPALQATRILVLDKMLTMDDLTNDAVFRDLYEDIEVECQRSGEVKSLVIPRPTNNGSQVPGLLKVFVEFATAEQAAVAQREVDGREFGDQVVVATFMDEMAFKEGKLDG